MSGRKNPSALSRQLQRAREAGPNSLPRTARKALSEDHVCVCVRGEGRQATTASLDTVGVKYNVFPEDNNSQVDLERVAFGQLRLQHSGAALERHVRRIQAKCVHDRVAISFGQDAAREMKTGAEAFEIPNAQVD